MRWKQLLLLMILAAATAEGAAAQAAGDASPRDARDIFLALPFPSDGARVLDRIGGRLSTRAGREEALREAEIGPKNGWLSIELSGGDALPLGVVLTSFTRTTDRRLVVLQVIDPELDEAYSVDFAWELEGSTFTPVDILDYLPHLEYSDFWDDPRPSGLEKEFFFRMGGYLLTWRREGTAATFQISTPAAYLGEPLDPELAELFRRRQRTGVQLRWDPRQGRFTKGQYLPPVTSGKGCGHHVDHD